MAGLGDDKVIIGCPYDSIAGEVAGAAYVFDLSGNLLRIYCGTGQKWGEFGASVAAFGTDRVLIGAPREMGAGATAGRAYLLTLDGGPLAVLHGPVRSEDALYLFGTAVAALGENRLLISAPRDHQAGIDAGAVYLFNYPDPPSLTLKLLAGNKVTISWPSPSLRWVLQQTDDLASGQWTSINESEIIDDGLTRTYECPMNGGACFFRLQQ